MHSLLLLLSCEHPAVPATVSERVISRFRDAAAAFVAVDTEEPALPLRFDVENRLSVVTCIPAICEIVREEGHSVTSMEEQAITMLLLLCRSCRLTGFFTEMYSRF